ncbi:WD40 repeat-like protein [Dendrothele bispora CBS 962.96]|uniref:WD40 repeat-like protein n=1 Tax=Dendrothele bispora (strain CBS 962.96) TaxID=1314807 RepID=A0A4S8MS82_DENBC|nr:WD40 repeat-like protein [Dendrothele bispora CBS 962.96]
MDATPVAVHRCRFVDFSPSAITALAFPPLPLPKFKHASRRDKYKFGSLAVGHANGNIDLYEWVGSQGSLQSFQSWAPRKTLTGLYPSKVDSLVFIIRYPHRLKPEDVPGLGDMRLFSSGGGSELLEWDMDHLCLRRTINSQGGSIWSVASNPACSMLALGCEDGTVRLVSVADDTLVHYRRFDRVKCRILSLSWGPPIPPQRTTRDAVGANESSDDDEDNDDWTDSWLVTGCSDSSLRKWDVATGRVLDKMGTDKIRGERTLVWTVTTLSDGTIVSGDSLGMIKFWDSRTCTQLQSFQAHGADVLCLAVGPDGSAVYSSGVDQKIIQFARVKTSQGDSESGMRFSTRWVQTSARRMHAHDVRTLAIWPSYTPLPPSHKREMSSDIAPILASGGLDMSVNLTPAALPSSTLSKVVNPLATSIHATFEDSYHRRLAYSTGPSSTCALHVSRKARLISCMRDSSLSIWKILKKPLSQEEGDEYPAENDDTSWEKCLEMDFDVHTNLVASAISEDGKWVVVSDMYETKLFSLQVDSQGRLNPRRIRDLTSALQPHLPGKLPSTGGLAFTFSPDSTKLVMSSSTTSYVLIIDISGDKPKVLRRFDHHRQPLGRVLKDLRVDEDVEMRDSQDDSQEDEGPIVSNIFRIAISIDGQWLATSDEHCRTHVFNLDSLQHHCVLPSFALPAQSLIFDHTRPNILILAFQDNTLQIYDVESRQFPLWHKELCDNLPKRFTQAHDPLLGVTFQPDSPDSGSSAGHAIFWGSTWICKLNLQGSNFVSTSKKRRRDNAKAVSQSVLSEESKEFKMITHYRPLLLVDFLSQGEMVVIERPLVDVLAMLPPAYFKHKYGAS